MKRYLVTLEKEEREELAGITRKGSHQSQKVINALILLNCDEGQFNEHRARGEAIAEILRISARKVDRVKKRFVGMEAASAGGRVAVPATCARPTASSRRAWWRAAPSLRATRSGRCGCWRIAVELGHIDSVCAAGSKKNELKPWRRVGWQRGFAAAGSRRLPARCGLSGGVYGRDAGN